jgi:hypothetical protein
MLWHLEGSCIVSKGMRSLALRTVTCNDALGVACFLYGLWEGSICILYPENRS